MKIVEMLLVKDEADRYLSRWLKRMDAICDEIVVVDNGSSDKTVEMLKACDKVKSIEVCDLEFADNERELRTRLFNLAMARNPDWIMAFDADEFVEDAMDQMVGEMVKREDIWWWSFRFHHFWGSEDYYRVDKLWNPQVGNVGPRMMKVDKIYAHAFANQDFACGSIPINLVRERKGAFCGMRIKHLGYARAEDIARKGVWYLEKDGGKAHANGHIQSILDTEFELEAWTE